MTCYPKFTRESHTLRNVKVPVIVTALPVSFSEKKALWSRRFQTHPTNQQLFLNFLPITIFPFFVGLLFFIALKTRLFLISPQTTPLFYFVVDNCCFYFGTDSGCFVLFSKQPLFCISQKQLVFHFLMDEDCSIFLSRKAVFHLSA